MKGSSDRAPRAATAPAPDPVESDASGAALSAGAGLSAGAVELERRAGVVDRLRDAERRVARAAAERFECLDALRREAEKANRGRMVRFELSPDIERRAVRAEAAMALRISEQFAEAELALAEALTTDLTATLEALRVGDITERHARLIWKHTLQVPADGRPAYEEQALQAARRLPPSRLKGKLRDLQERLHPDTATVRHQQAVQTREVWVDPLPDGMAVFSIRDSAAKVLAIQNRIDQYARGLRGDRDEIRTLSQLRADVATEFLCTGDLGNVKITPTVQLVIPALSMVGKSEEPAVLDGYGPIDLDTARQLFADAKELIRVVTDPVTGTVLDVDTYRIPRALRAWLRIRDGRCRAPGCGRSIDGCEIDHTRERAADGGETRSDNLANVCTNHHKIKTLTAWTYRHLDQSGTLEWTSPLGQKYLDEPAVRMRGLADGPPGENSGDPPNTGLSDVA